MSDTLTVEQVKRGKAFVKALRENPLKAHEEMRNSDGGRCCLCVAYDVAQEMGAGLPEAEPELPPREIAGWYGWDSSNPYISNMQASAWNDATGDDEVTHAEIADMFEEKYPQLQA